MIKKADHKPTSRVLDILELLASSAEGMTLTEIAEGINAPKSTLSPIIHQLLERRFLYCSKYSMKYSIGISSFLIGASYTENLDILQFIKEEMKHIVTVSGEICQLGIRDQDKVLYLAKEDSDRAIRLISYVGKRLPLYCTALGKSLLSNTSIEEIKRLYPNGLEPVNSKTITDFKLLEKELLETQKTGISVDNEEVTEQIYCISTPLYKGKEIVAGISVSTPTFRLTEEKVEQVKSLLLQSRKKIETFLREKDVDISSLMINA
ncbi:MAG: IclR family transcriptional regulator [Clostridiaceae bacterium]